MEKWDGIERRRFVRVKLPCEITLRTPEENIVPVQVENISAGGIGIITEERLEIGSIVDLDIYAIKEKPITCKGKVVWVAARETPAKEEYFVFDAGIEFYDIKEGDRDLIKKLVVSVVTGK